MERQSVQTEGLTLSVLIAGEGPLVILCHGFPELAWSWRAQIPTLAAAGFRAVAPDMRGYGATGGPTDAGAYTILHLVGDVVGLVEALGERQAVIVGHDWGAPVAWHAALLRPDVFRAVAALSVPFMPRKAGRAPLPTWDALTRGKGSTFYMSRFARDDGAETARLEADPAATLLRMITAYDGATPAERRSNGFVPDGALVLDGLPEPQGRPSWLSDEDLAVYAEAFRAGGFARPLNWYRNLDRNFELGAAWQGKRVDVPALFVVGENDPVRMYAGHAEAGLKDWAPDLRGAHVLPRAGHWLQQERPEEVNELLLGFLRGL